MNISERVDGAPTSPYNIIGNAKSLRLISIEDWYCYNDTIKKVQVNLIGDQFVAVAIVTKNTLPDTQYPYYKLFVLRTRELLGDIDAVSLRTNCRTIEQYMAAQQLLSK